MSNRASPIRSHPLELSRSEDDDESSPIGGGSISFNTDNQSIISSGSSHMPSTDTHSHSVTSSPRQQPQQPQLLVVEKKPQPPPIPPKPLKRMAPRLPDEILVQHSRRSQLGKSPSSETFSSNKSTTASLENKQQQQFNFYIDIDQVRWFYKNDKEPTQTGATSPVSSSSSIHTDLQSLAGDVSTVGDAIGTSTTSSTSNNSTVHTSKKWHMFSKWDSILLEREYRDMMMSQGGGGGETSEDNVKLVQVLDSMYEVNLSTRKCYPIYWRQMRTMTVRRCLWFKDNEPLDEKVSDEIERKHVELFRDSLISSRSLNNNETNESSEASLSSGGGGAKSDEELSATAASSGSKSSKEAAIGTLSFEDGTVTWYSRDEVYWGKNKPNLLDYLVGISKMGSKPPVAHALRIKRGYKDKSKEGDLEEPPREPTHLVFVIHGIAQKLYENSIIKNCEDIRKECEKKKKEHFPLHSHLKYVYLPVDWRSSLTLDDGIVETITPKSIQTIRDKLNSSALDIMYYTSPLFRSEIINSLTSELNKLYNLFCLKNPGFKMHDKVSLVAHSLGSVITYDILTSGNSISLLMSNAYGEDTDREKMLFNHFSHNDSQLLNDYLSCKSRIQEIEMGLLKANKTISALEFKTENFFILGSPLAVFLALRGVRPAGVGSQEHILPKHICKRLFNVFHPCDPVAYRLEPLILKHYATKSPIEVQKTGEVSYKEMNEKRSALNVDLKSTLATSHKAGGGGGGVGGGGTIKRKDKDARSAELNQIKEEVSMSFSAVLAATSVTASTATMLTTTSAPSSNPSSPNNSSPIIDQVELESAIDYQLQDYNFELVAAIRAHTGYWKSADVGMFIIHQLCVNDYDPIKQNC